MKLFTSPEDLIRWIQVAGETFTQETLNDAGLFAVVRGIVNAQPPLSDLAGARLVFATVLAYMDLTDRLPADQVTRPRRDQRVAPESIPWN